MKLSVFVGVSLDGFLARPNGQYDFLAPYSNEPHGYEEFMATVDTILIGHNTFDVVMKFPDWPYSDKRVVVLSHRPLDLGGSRGRVQQMSGEPGQIVANLAAAGGTHVYVDGGITVQDFLRAGQIHDLIINRYPVLIGQGIPLFGSLPQDIKLRHLGTHEYKSGALASHYEVIR
jgi:dihydrofolate reductase